MIKYYNGVKHAGLQNSHGDATTRLGQGALSGDGDDVRVVLQREKLIGVPLPVRATGALPSDLRSLSASTQSVWQGPLTRSNARYGDA